MSSLLSSKMVAVAGLGAAAFVGYCIYFDYKRRSAPEYKDSIRQKRREVNAGDGAGDDQAEFDLDLNNPAQIHHFFIEEMQKGEALLEQGQTEKGATHLANAIIFSGQTEHIMGLLQQTMPPAQFAAVVNQLPVAGQRLRRLTQRTVAEKVSNKNIAEEDFDNNRGDVGEEIEIPKMQDLMQDDDLE